MKRALIRVAFFASFLLCLATALGLDLTFLSVGQGTSVLIQASTGQTALYDAGPSGSNVAAQLRELGVTNIALVIASHAHADHIGGMQQVLAAYAPTYYLDNGMPYTTATYERTLLAAQAAGSQLLEPTLRNITLGDVTLTIIPPPGQASLGQNNNSVGVRVQYGDFSALLSGDAEKEQWAWWLANYPDLISNVDVHLASHHGSRNGDTRDGLDRLQPDVVVISLGAGNQYGHPHAEALNLYVGAQVLRTDTHGRITIHVEPNGTYRASTTGNDNTMLARVPSPAPAPPPAQAAPPAPRQSSSQQATSNSGVNINTASAIELEQIIHIGPDRAEIIIRLRAQAPFRSVADLRRVSGIGPARLADIQRQGLAFTN